jgi:hypothetical protein
MLEGAIGPELGTQPEGSLGALADGRTVGQSIPECDFLAAARGLNSVSHPLGIRHAATTDPCMSGLMHNGRGDLARRDRPIEHKPRVEYAGAQRGDEDPDGAWQYSDPYAFQVVVKAVVPPKVVRLDQNESVFEARKDVRGIAVADRELQAVKKARFRDA